MTRSLLAALFLLSAQTSLALPVKSETILLKDGAGIGLPGLMVFDAPRGEIWIGGQSNSRLAVLDATTKKVTTVFKDVKGISRLAVDPSRDRVYAVRNGYKLLTFKASTKELLSTRSLLPSNAVALGVAVDGSLLVLHYKWDSSLSQYQMMLIKHDAGDLSAKAVYDFPVGYSYNTHPIYVDDSGIYLTRTIYKNSSYSSELWIFNADLSLKQKIDTGAKTYLAHIARDPRNGRVFVGNQLGTIFVFDKTAGGLALSGTIPNLKYSRGLVIDTANERLIHISNVTPQIKILDLQSYELIHSSSTPWPNYPVSVVGTPSNKSAFVGFSGSAAIIPFPLGAGTPGDPIDLTRDFPGDIVFSQATDELIISGAQSGSLIFWDRASKTAHYAAPSPGHTGREGGKMAFFPKLGKGFIINGRELYAKHLESFDMTTKKIKDLTPSVYYSADMTPREADGTLLVIQRNGHNTGNNADWYNSFLLAIDAQTESIVSSFVVGRSSNVPTSIAASPHAAKAYVAFSRSHQIAVADLDKKIITKRISVGYHPSAIAVEPLWNRIYVANLGSDSVSVIDGATEEVIATLPVGKSPTAIAVKKKGVLVYVVNSGDDTMTVINGQTLQVIGTVALDGATSLRVDQETEQIFTANHDAASVTIFNDPTPAGSAAPVITHQPHQGLVAEGASVLISAEVTDDQAVAVVSLSYWAADGSGSGTKIMEHTSGNLYQAEIPTSFMNLLGGEKIHYYIDATDFEGNGPATGSTPGTEESPNSITIDRVITKDWTYTFGKVFGGFYRMIPGPSAAIGELRSDHAGLEIATGNEEYWPLGTGYDKPPGRWFVYGSNGTVVFWKSTQNDEAHSSINLYDLDGDGTPEMLGGTTSGNQVQAFDAHGEWFWRYKLGSHHVSTPAVDVLEPGGAPVVFGGAFDAYARAIDGKTGKLRWALETDGRIWSTASVGDLDGDGKKEMIIASENWTYNGAGMLYSLDADTGTVNWTKPMGNQQRSSPAIADLDGDGKTEILIGTAWGSVYKSTGVFYALNGGTGETLWSFPTTGGVFSSPAVGDLDGDGQPEIVFGTDDGMLYALNADGSVFWSRKLGNAIYSSPALARRGPEAHLAVYIITFEGILYIIDGRNGETISGYGVGSDVVSSPSVADTDGDGKLEIYFQDRRGDKTEMIGDMFWALKDEGSSVKPFAREWPMFRRDSRHTGVYPWTTPVVVVPPAPDPAPAPEPTPAPSQDPIVTGLEILPLNPHITAGDKQQFEAVCTWDDGTTRTLSKAWNDVIPLPTARFRPSAQFIGGTLYVAGGSNKLDMTTLESYTPGDTAWKTLASLPKTDNDNAGRFGAISGVINGKLYLAGGWRTTPVETTDTLLIYDPAADKWTTGAKMPAPNGCGGGGVIDGKLYVASFCNPGNTVTQVLYIYDPLTDSWTTGAKPLTDQNQTSGVVLGGKLYLVGGGNNGFNHYDFLNVYDPVTDKWEAKAPLPTARTGNAVGVLNGKIYVTAGDATVTGSGVKTGFNITEVYDPASDTWTSGPAAPSTRAWTGFASHDNKFYVIGGLVDGVVPPLNTVEVLDGDAAALAWTSGSPSIASIDMNGLATGLVSGQSKISATCGGLTADAVLTIGTPLPAPDNLRSGWAWTSGDHLDRQVSWDVVDHPSVTSYRVYVQYPGSSEFVLEMEVSSAIAAAQWTPIEGDGAYTIISFPANKSSLTYTLRRKGTAHPVGEFLYKIRAVGVSGNESPDSEIVRNTHSGPLEILSVSGNPPLVKWEGPLAGETDYINMTVFKKPFSHKVGNSLILSGDKTTSGTLDMTGLSVGVTYYLQVYTQAQYNTNKSQKASLNGQKMPFIIPSPFAAPSPVVEAPSPGGELRISWTALDDSDITGYKVYRDGVFLISTSTTAVGNTGLTDGTTYLYEVSGIDADGNEGPKGSISGVPHDLLPPLSKVLLPADGAIVLTTTAAVSGTAVDAGVAGVGTVELILKDVTAGTETSLPASGTTVFNLTLNGLEFGHTYQIASKAHDKENNEESSPVFITFSIPVLPGPVQNLAAVSSDEGTSADITWDPSASGEPAVSYKVYKGDTLVATVTAEEFAALELEPGAKYTYSVSGVDKYGREGPKTAIAFITTDVGSAKACIKIPKEGKSLWGNAVTIVATGDEETVTVVTQYRYRCAYTGDPNGHQHPSYVEKKAAEGGDYDCSESAAGEWTAIATDSKKPWAVYWNISDAITQTGTYDIRTVAYDSDGLPDLDPDSCLRWVFIDDANADHIEDGNPDVNPNKNHKLTAKVTADKDHEIITADGTSVVIPEGTVDEGEFIEITTISPEKITKLDSKFAKLKPAGVFKEFTFKSGKKKFANNLKLTLPVPDEDGDGIVDGTDIKVTDLKAYYFDEDTDKWVPLGSSAQVGLSALAAANGSSAAGVSFLVDHFTLFGLFQTFALQQENSFGEVYSFPNPAQKGQQPTIHIEAGPADEVIIRIYDLTGSLVHSVTIPGPPGTIDDGQGPEQAFEYQWNTSGLGSGTYHFVVTAKQKEVGRITTSGRISIIR